MRFAILGPLEVHTDDGRTVRVRERKVRTLLADLLAHEGQVVPADRLIDDLWGDEPPADAPAALQTRVWHLRRALDTAEPGARDLVVSQAPGYVLHAADLDAARFRALVAEGRLDEALGLWRGPALADFADAVFAAATITHLEELRLTALEDQAERHLALGVQVELAALVAEHPLRERLRALHMRALYRAGRQGEALDVYAQGRALLADELGLDPGRELTALHEAILRQDPSLDPPPSQLPAALTDLVGREHALRHVRSSLDRFRLVTLTGPGGVGKTSLAVEAARGHPGARLVELADSGDPAQAVIEAFGLRDESDLAAALRAQRTSLLVLDNCEHLIEPTAALTAGLLRDVPSLRVLATSREPLAIPGEHAYAVPPLDTESATLLLTTLAPGLTPDEAAALVPRLDGIPLAIELAATRARTLGVHALAERLDQHLLTTEQRGTHSRQRTLRAVIDWSWDLLTGPERTVLRRLAVHADGCTLEAAAHTCAEPGVDLADTLARLVDRSLLTPGPRHRLLQTVKTYCLERLEEAGETAATRERHAAYHTALAERADPCLRGPDQREWLAVLDAEAANMRAALEHAPADLAHRLVDALAWYWFLRGRLTEARRHLANALQRGPNARAAAWLAAFTLLSGEPADPGAALALFRDDAFHDDAAGLARAQWFLAFAQRGIGEATHLADTALASFGELGDRWGTAAALSTRAARALLAGDLTALHADAQAALDLFRALGDRWGQARAADQLATHAEITGDYARATALRTESLRLVEELGLTGEISWRLSGLGRLALLTGDHERSRELHTRAKRLAAEQASKPAEEFAQTGLALTARRQGHLDEAEAHLRTWLDWMRLIDARPGAALVLAELGFVAEQRGDAATALALHLQGLTAARASDDPRAVALALEGLAGAHSLAGRHELAAHLLATATATRRAVGAPLPAAERGDVDRIESRVRQALGDRRVEPLALDELFALVEDG
ncbi:BTAD domain-containing putative transcriptional regulator [Nonomuraea sp. NPDC059194]|uniref:BTAD domain-containing putative transcriptional regulator n=1 Tax=Nonomuraea sp. NPDC059194 TaxID=3346764 RepID=UPI0036BCEDDA